MMEADGSGLAVVTVWPPNPPRMRSVDNGMAAHRDDQLHTQFRSYERNLHAQGGRSDMTAPDEPSKVQNIVKGSNHKKFGLDGEAGCRDRHSYARLIAGTCFSTLGWRQSWPYSR